LAVECSPERIVEKEEYRRLFELEDELWWFVGMRALSLALIDRFIAVKHPLSIIDVGCGTGGMIPHLETYGPVVGVDRSTEALSFAKRRERGYLVQGGLPRLPFASHSFDLVTSFDVIYHRAVENDDQALAEMARLLKPGGALLLRVPAHDRLRGQHDVAVHTRHRYERDELAEKLRKAGLEPSYISYANCFLFPVAAALRLAERIGHREGDGSDVKRLPGPVNAVFASVLRLEASIVRWGSLPFGLSLVAVATRPESAPS
jgi:SAM-dependent methyltransferase